MDPLGGSTPSRTQERKAHGFTSREDQSRFPCHPVGSCRIGVRHGAAGIGRYRGAVERFTDRGRHGRGMESGEPARSHHQRIPQRNSVGPADGDAGPHRQSEGGRVQDDQDPRLLPGIHRARPELHDQRLMAEQSPRSRQLCLQQGSACADQHARRRVQERQRLLADLRFTFPGDDQGQVRESLAADREQVQELRPAPDPGVHERGVRRAVRPPDPTVLLEHQQLQPDLRGHRAENGRKQQFEVAARGGWNTNIDYTAGNYGFALPSDQYRSPPFPRTSGGS